MAAPTGNAKRSYEVTLRPIEQGKLITIRASTMDNDQQEVMELLHRLYGDGYEYKFKEVTK